MNRQDEALAKIARPRNRLIVQRAGLFRRLDEMSAAAGIWVSGPPGSGKTALVSSYTSQQERPCIWYQVDDTDGDIATLFWYLRLAAKRLVPTLGDELEAYSSAYQKSLKTFATNYFEKLYSLLPPGFLIVFDNYQEATNNSDLAGVIAQAIEMLPHYANVLIISREMPPGRFSRLLVNEQLAQLDWDDLRLSSDEIREIVKLRRPGHTDACVADLQSRSGGWAAGLMFHLQNIHMDDCGRSSVKPGCHASLFSYFANEVLEQQDPEACRLVMVMALLPLMTQEMVVRLTGDERAITLLNWLQRKNYFVELQSLRNPTYRFHTLFRDYLLDRLRQKLTAAEIHDLEKLAAELLEEAGYPAAALKLYLSCAEWPDAIRLINAGAPEQLKQGRIRSLERAIDSLPAEIIDQHPWIIYWQGMSCLFFDAPRANRLFLQALDTFREKNDRSGALAAWSGAVNSLLTDWADITAIDSLIGVGEELLAAQHEVTNKALTAQAVTAMCSALAICRPHSPDMEKFAAQTHGLIVAGGDRTFGLMSSNLLLVFYAWHGEITRMRLLVESLSTDMEEKPVSDAHEVMWAAATAWYELVAGSPTQALEISMRGLEVAERSGVHMFDYKFYGMATQANLFMGCLPEARQGIEGYLKVIPGKANLLQFHVHLLSAWQAWLAGEMNESREQLAIARHFLNLAGAPPIVTAKTDIAAAILKYAADERAEAQVSLERAKRVGNSTGSHWLQYHCALVEADFALREGRRKECLEHLGSGLLIGKTHGLVRTDWWNESAMSHLCALALDKAVVPEQALLIIEQTALHPPATEILPEAWPWPVRIKCFGQFELHVDSEQIGVGALRQRKVIELIKSLVALGGEDVPAIRLADALWPDAEGDDARNALKTTIHRLRKLLGTNAAIEMHNGLVSLSTRYCWVDALAFSRLVKTSRRNPDRLDNIKQALALYTARFLEGEEGPWVIAPRQKLQKMTHEIVMELGTRHELKSQWNKAIRVYRRGLDTDAHDEQVCRHLMRCYTQSGRTEAALAAYEHCCDELKVHHARRPSQKTRLLAETLQIN